jgi:hypothetical protein
MCLSETTTKQPMIAEKDIICYKFLRQRESRGGLKTFHAPYQGNRYLFGKLNTYVQVKLDYDDEVEEGYHSFAKLKDAYETAESRNRVHSFDLSKRRDFVFVCVIPKGTPYFEGEFRGRVSYASSQLKVLSRKDPRSIRHVKNLPANAVAKFP